MLKYVFGRFIVKQKFTWVNEPDGILYCYTLCIVYCLVDIWSRGKFGNE